MLLYILIIGKYNQPMDTATAAIDQKPETPEYARYSSIARDIYGVRIDTSTTDTIRDFLALTRELDNPDINASEVFTKLVENTQEDQNMGLEQMYPNLTEACLGKERFEYLKALAEQLFDVTHRYRATKDFKEFCKLRQLEGFLYAEMLLTCFSDSARESPGFAVFAHDLHVFAESSILADSAVDAAKDFANNEIAFRLSAIERIRLLGSSALRARQLSPNVFTPQAVRIAARKARELIHSRNK